jgi:hypothetical protein
MRILTIAVALAATALAGSATAADIAGVYIAAGSCPAPGTAYRGTLEIQGTGLFHILTWRVGEDTIVGRGMEHDGRMAIEFRFADGAAGLMEMIQAGRSWRGTWAIYGTELLCTETWDPA